MIRTSKIIILLLVITLSNHAMALRTSTPLATDHRLRVIPYSPYDVFKFIGYYKYQASIEFSKDEVIRNISMGDTTSWQVVPDGNRIFLKPMELDATTNMTLITDKRTYYFELYAEEASDIRAPDMVFNIKFLYPDDEEEENIDIKSYATNSANIDLHHPENYNFNYTINGHNDISPIKIFDDGDFTYIQFRDRNAEMPAVFAVDEDLRESLVNFHISANNPNLMVVEQVFSKLSLRLGKKIVCIFNEAAKLLQRP